MLACGGTQLGPGGNEVVWNANGNGAKQRGGATGGGVSNVFERPAWQVHAARGRARPRHGVRLCM